MYRTKALLRSLPGRLASLVRSDSTQDTPPVRETAGGAVSTVGLGTACLTSHLLKQMGLKRSSMPFDWIFSSPEMIEHAIKDDFRIFLSREYISPISVDRRPDPNLYRAENTFYRDNFGVGYIFVHHDPVENQDDYAYLSRCVDRLRGVLASTTPSIFLLTKVVAHPPRDHHHATYERLANLLRPHALLCVELFHDARTSPHLEIVKRSQNLIVSNFLTVSPHLINGTTFPESADYEALTRHIRENSERLGAALPHRA